jgi:predicted metal-binding protein
MSNDTADSPASPPAPVTLTVCLTCRTEGADPDGTRPGAILHAALQEAGMPEGVTLRGVKCLSACSRGCSVALTGGEARWTYVYGDMDPAAHVTEILDGTAAYAATADGLVPWRERPTAFRKQSVARIPPAAFPSEE